MRLINQIQAFKDGGGLKRPNNITDDQWNKAIELYNSAIKSGDKFPELTLAQAVLETGWFKSPAGRYNYFGQKATKTQQGSTKSTKEVYGGNTVRENAKFRDYNNIDEAMSDRQRLWGSKYQNAETIEEALYSIWNYNPEKQQGEGYATDPEYDTKIKSILENFGISFNARATERKPLSNTITPSPTPTLDELNRISPADIWEMYKDEPSKAAELIAFKNEYEERLQKEAQAEKQAEIDLQKQALAQAQQEKQIVQKLLTTPTTPQEDYNAQIAQPQQPTQPFRFQTDWFNPMQEMQRGGTKTALRGRQSLNLKKRLQEIENNQDFIEVLTPMGIDFLMEAEGFRDRPYLDTAKVPTIGYGTTYYPDGRPVSMNDTAITEEQAKRYKNNSLMEFWEEIEKSINQPLEPHQKDAVVSLAYNIGPDAFKQSTLLKLLNSNPNDPRIEKEFLKWNKERDRQTNKYREVKGLTNRRQREASIYFNGYETESLQQGGTISPLQKIKQKFQQGGTVREIYEKKTGKDWSTARAEGLTDGSYESNMRLRDSLLNGADLSLNQQTPTSTDYNNYNSFNEAFKNARQELGANQTFEYKGKKYSTNTAGEKFDPPKQVLQDNGLGDRANSPYTSKEFEEVYEEELEIYNENDPIQLEEAVFDRFNRVNDREYARNKKTIEEFQQANNLTPDGIIGPETASLILGENLEGGKDTSFISKERAEFESKVRNAPKPSIFDGKPEWFSVGNSEGGHCLGGVCNFYEKVTGESITANVKPGTEYVDFQGNKRVYGEDAIADRVFQNRVRTSNNDFENNASLLGFKQINYGNENRKAIDESLDFDLDRFKKEEPEYYQVLADVGVTPEKMATYGALEKYVTKKPVELKYKADKGNMYVPRVGDIVMFRNYDSRGRHAEIIKSIDYSDKDNPVYTLYHNQGKKNSPTVPVEFTLEELQEMMSGERGRGNSRGFDYISIFTKDEFEGKSESEANVKSNKYADSISKAKATLLGEEAVSGKKYEYSGVDVDLGSEPLTGFDTEVDTSDLPKEYNKYARAIKKTPPSKYSDIEKTDLENLYAIALSIPSVESGFGKNSTYKVQALAQRVVPGMTEAIAGGSTSAGLSRINVSSLTKKEKEKYFINNESEEVKKWLKGKNKSKLKDSDFTEMLVEIPELNAEITLDKIVNQYRRFKNNPDLYENRESLFWSYLALSHRSPNAYRTAENQEEGIFNFGPEEGSYESKAQAYVNKVLENARKIKVKIKQ